MLDSWAGSGSFHSWIWCVLGEMWRPLSKEARADLREEVKVVLGSERVVLAWRVVVKSECRSC